MRLKRNHILALCKSMDVRSPREVMGELIDLAKKELIGFNKIDVSNFEEWIDILIMTYEIKHYEKYGIYSKDSPNLNEPLISL